MSFLRLVVVVVSVVVVFIICRGFVGLEEAGSVGAETDTGTKAERDESERAGV